MQVGQPGPHPKHLVILVHGIVTRALWMNEVAAALEQAGFAVASTSYGKYPIWSFVLRLKGPEERAIERLTHDISDAILIHKPEKVSIIAHSFGTHIFSKILSDRDDLKWYRIIFCGSVLRDDYSFTTVLSRFDAPLLNEVGSEDLWPAVAEKIGYGGVGSYGFNRPAVKTRWHNKLSHSDFLNEQFCRENWVPFLRGDPISPGDKAFTRPWFRMPEALRRLWERRRLIAYPVVVTAGVGLMVVWIILSSVIEVPAIKIAQKALCIEDINGQFDFSTRDAVKEFLIARKLAPDNFIFAAEAKWSDLSASQLGALMDARSAVGDCKNSQYKNAFEVGTFARNPNADSRYIISQFQRELSSVLRGTDVAVPVTGLLDPKTREAIRVLRKQFGLSSSDEVDLDFLKKKAERTTRM